MFDDDDAEVVLPSWTIAPLDDDVDAADVTEPDPNSN